MAVLTTKSVIPHILALTSKRGKLLPFRHFSLNNVCISTKLIAIGMLVVIKQRSIVGKKPQ